MERDAVKKADVLHWGICYHACSNGPRFANGDYVVRVEIEV